MLPESSGQFKSSAFQKPEPFHRPVYMWCWNSPITADMLTEQLRELAEAGAGGVMIVPEPSYFRPTTMKTTLSPDYLTEDYFAIYKAVAEQAEKLGLKIWFYDEGGWPSGSACGKVTQKYPHLACKRLARYEQEATKGDTIEPGAMAQFLYTETAVIPVKAGEPVPEDGRLVSIVMESAKGSSEPLYPDLLSSEAVRAFIEIGCEPYLPHIGGYAGSTVPLLFTDETRVCNPPWSDNFAGLFKEEKGYDITERLNELFETGENGAQTRIDFFDFWTKIFAKSFFAAMREWCNKNGMAFGGHLGGDDAIACIKQHGYGHPLRMYREMDVPGIDTILRQIFPGGRRGKLILDRKDTDYAPNYHFPRWASSVARQAGNPWVLSESFAVYGQGLTPAEMKWIVNYQAARGITLFCAATLASSVSGPYMANERPVQTVSSPVWQCLNDFHTYTARLSYLLSRGTPDIKTALYMPVRDVWSNTPQSERVMEEYDFLAAMLERRKIDFDIIDDDCLDAAELFEGYLKIGEMLYNTVILPKCQYMAAPAVLKLEAFKNAGGKVYSDLKKIKGPVKIEPERALAGFTVRNLEHGRLYFLTNEDEKEISLTVTFPEQTAPVLLEAETGKVYAPAYTVTDSGIKITLRLPFAGSAAVLFGVKVKANAANKPAKSKYREIIPLNEGWEFRRSKAFIIGEQEFEVKKFRGSPKPAGLGSWASLAGEDFSGEGVYSLNFDCSTDTAHKKVLLTLGKVEAACRVSINGQKLPLSPWPPFEYDLTGLLRGGNNRLEVTVINTPANQYITTTAFDKWDAATVGRYHNPALVFEKESASGGLYGKVLLYVE